MLLLLNKLQNDKIRLAAKLEALALNFICQRLLLSLIYNIRASQIFIADDL